MQWIWKIDLIKQVSRQKFFDFMIILLHKKTSAPFDNRPLFGVVTIAAVYFKRDIIQKDYCVWCLALFGLELSLFNLNFTTFIVTWPEFNELLQCDDCKVWEFETSTLEMNVKNLYNLQGYSRWSPSILGTIFKDTPDDLQG